MHWCAAIDDARTPSGVIACMYGNLFCDAMHECAYCIVQSHNTTCAIQIARHCTLRFCLPSFEMHCLHLIDFGLMW